MNRHILATAIIVLLSACGRNTDFLHHVVPSPLIEPTVMNVKVKDMVGDNKVDIVWVIDNSASMSDDQQLVIQNTKVFMDEFTKKSSIDWKMGVLSTDYSDDPYVGFTPATTLDRTTADPVRVFQDAVRKLGTFGSGTEMFFEPLILTFSSHPNFLRPDAMLAVIVVTDAPEQSIRYKVSDFTNFVQVQKKRLSRLLAYGVLWPQEWCPGFSGDSTFYYKGSPYETLFTSVKGKTYPLCNANFGVDLADMGKDIVKHISTARIQLTKRPRVSSLQVFHKGEELKGGLKSEKGYWLYDYDLNAVVFHDLAFAPGDKEEVEVRYREDDGTIER